MKPHLWLYASVPLLLAAQASHAANYYVATTGNDTNAGTEAAPFKTIQKAANIVNAGDTVYIRGGTYNGLVLVTKSGTAGNPITFTNYAGETPVLDATGKTSADYWNGVFTIRGTATSKTSHVRVSGLKIQNNTANNGFGISCYYCADSEIRNNKTYNTRISGIVVGYGDRVVVDGNDIEKANNTGEQENLSILRESSFVTVTNNVVHDNGNDSGGGEGIDIKQGSHDVLVQGNTVYNNTKVGIYVESWDKLTYNIVVDRNKIYSIGKSGVALGSECGGPLRNVTISNNLIYNNTRHGVNVGIWGDLFGQCGSPAPTPGNINGVKIVNNTIVGNGQNGINYTRDTGLPVHPEFGNIYIANNLIHDNGHKTLNFPGCPISHNAHAEVVSHYTIENNLLNGTSGKPRCDWGSEMLGTNPLLAAPQLVSATDFHLTASSPAIDAGTANHAPDHDYDGLVRPMNGLWDLGAYEFSGQPPALNITTTSLPQATVGANYTAQANASGGVAPYNWQIVSGVLPNGLNLSATGVISGVPSLAGTATISISVTDANGTLDTQELSLLIAEQPVAPPPSITTTSLSQATVGTAYTAQANASGGTAPYTWSLAAGSLPTGLTLGSDGKITGTPTTAGTFSFTLAVTDQKAATDTQAISITVAAQPVVLPPDITTTSLTAGTTGTAYNATLKVGSGTAPYSWSVSSGSLPAGLSLSSAGVISGTPTAAGTPSFSVKVTDSNGLTDTQALSLVINAAPPVTGNADMALTLFKATKTAVKTGVAAEFSFTIKNNGNDAATNARFSLPLPTGMVWVSGAGECSAASGNVTCNFGNLAKSASRTRYIYLRPTVAGSHTLEGVASSDKGDSNMTNNSKTVTLTAQ